MTLCALAMITVADADASVVDVEYHRLENGLEVLLLPEPGRGAVSLQTWYRVGSSHEDAETVGFAHLFEHLMHSGTDSVPAFQNAVTRLGGRSGSASWPDVTSFYVEVPATALESALALETDRMRGLALTDAVIQQTVAVITEELARIIQSSPNYIVENRLRAIAYDPHPYANPPMGSPSNPNQLTTARCQSFYDQFYRPNNACLTLVGDFEPTAAMAAIRATFGRLEAGTTPPPRVEAPPPSHTGRDAIDLGSPLPVVAIAYRVPGERSQDRSTVRLLASYLSGPGSEAMLQALNPAPAALPAVAAIDVNLELDGDGGLLIVSVTLLDGLRIDEIEKEVLAMLDETGARIQETDLEPIRDRELFSTLNLRRNLSNRAAALAAAQVIQGSHTHYASVRSDLDAVERAALVRVAELLAAENAVVVHLLGATR
jgi:zinc protease